MASTLRSSPHRTVAEYILKFAHECHDEFIYPMRIESWLAFHHGRRVTTNTISVCLQRLKKNGLMVNVGRSRWCHVRYENKMRKLAEDADREARLAGCTAKKLRVQRKKRRQLREFRALLG